MIYIYIYIYINIYIYIYITKTSCISKNSSKVSNKNKQGMLICNLMVRIYQFQNHSANWYMRSSKKSSH